MAIRYNTSVVRDGLVLQLDAANPKSYPGSGTTWFDLSGDGNNGTLVNGVGYSSADNGSLVFDGVNDYNNCTNIIGGLNNYSAEFWFNISVNTIGIEHWLGSQYIATTGRVIFDISSNNCLRNFVNGTSVIGSTVIPIDIWHHAFFTRNSIGLAEIYLNGSLEISNTISDVSVLNTDFQIGGSSVLSRWFTGKISLVNVYNRALTASEIQQNFEATRGRYGI
jgi:hypothetical protein